MLSLMLDGQEVGPIRRQYVAQAKYPVRPGAAGRKIRVGIEGLVNCHRNCVTVIAPTVIAP